MMGTTHKTAVPARDAENIRSLQYARERNNRIDKTAQYEAHSTYKYSSWTTYYKEEMGGARNMHGRDDKNHKTLKSEKLQNKDHYGHKCKLKPPNRNAVSTSKKILFKLKHVSSGLGYRQEEISEHTEATTVQMLKHNSIGNITRRVFVIPLT